MEEAWLSGVAGQLKMWAATKKLPELEVCLSHQLGVIAFCTCLAVDETESASS